MVVPVLAALMAFLVGGLLIIISGKNPIEAYGYLFYGAFGSMGMFGETILKAIPLVFTGLAATFAYRCGIFNLGGEGQFIMGAIASSYISCTVLVNMQGPGNLILSLLMGAVAGGIWGLVPGLLKAYAGLNEMIVTILLNYVAALFMDYLYSGPLMEASIPQTVAIAEASRLAKIIPGTRVHAGLFITIITVAVCQYFIFHTSKGYKMRVVGFNPTAGLCNGMNVKRLMVMSIVVSGVIAGLGGSVDLHGVSYRLQQGYASGFGFDGVAIALIGQLSPIGTAFVAFLFAILRTGANSMQVASGISTSVVDIIQALVIIFMVAGTALVNMPALSRFFSKFDFKQKAVVS